MKTVLISGSNSGIGYATALELARHGYRVMAGMRSLERGAELFRQAAAENLPIEGVVLDVNSEASREQAVQTVLERHGSVDVLVNNAGVGIIGPAEEVDMNQVRQGFETNVFGPMRLAQLVLPGMRSRQAGCIVNVSSVAGRLATGAQAFYAASKFALEAATEVLAQEVRKFGIRVVIIEPGVTRTPALSTIPSIKPDTAYMHILAKSQKTLGALINQPAEPTTVAAGIRDAIESPVYKLRHPLGDDTRLLLAGRAKLSDEDWVDYGRDMSDAELDEFWKRYFGMAT